MSGRNAKVIRRLAYKANREISGEPAAVRVFKRWFARLDRDGKATSRAVILKDRLRSHG